MDQIDLQANQPLRLWTGEVLPEWLDYNGHMTEHRYLQVFGESSDALYQLLGVDFARADDGAFYTMESHIWHKAECQQGTALWSDTQILAHDAKRLHLWHRIFDAAGTLLAEAEHLAIHVRHGKAQEASPAMQDRIARIYQTQLGLALPEGSGHVLKKRLAHHRDGE